MKKKLVIITGAGRGIGKAVSETLASCGYTCVLIARNLKEIKNVEKKSKKLMVLLSLKYVILQIILVCKKQLKKLFQNMEIFTD